MLTDILLLTGLSMYFVVGVYLLQYWKCGKIRETRTREKGLSHATDVLRNFSRDVGTVIGWPILVVKLWRIHNRLRKLLEERQANEIVAFFQALNVNERREVENVRRSSTRPSGTRDIP